VSTVSTAMVLAAGLGTRMRPLTNDRPKALVQVGGQALIDHVLDRLVAAGITRAVVNVHAFADLLEAHVRRRTDLEVGISDERTLLMETGGGVRQALPLLGDGPIVVANIDSVWEESGGSAIARLIAGYNAGTMGARLMLADMDGQLGYDGAGDFHAEADGRIRFRGEVPSAPFAYMGVQVIDPALVAAEPLEPFSFTRVWRRLAAEGRLYGAPLGGFWMHVGDPQAREAAEARLAAAAGAVL
jgi:N-acetyl-alpha-D-muramate 1-phosphate uridylyltransferase